MVDSPRRTVHFDSEGVACAAWHYPGTNGACLVMAGGFAVPRGPGTERFAARFHAAGFTVLAFDYRRIGDSGGQPRQVLPIADQMADWRAAVRFAGTLPGVDAGRIAVWGFSASGGHVLRLAARYPAIAAVIAQTPIAGGLRTTLNASRYQTPLAMLRFAGLGIVDLVGGWFGRAPRLVPLAGPRGTVAMLTTPDGQLGNLALNPTNRYPDWVQAVAARSTLPLSIYRPGRYARRVHCPLLVVVAADDRSAPAAPAEQVARRAPHAELVRLNGGHYAPFLDAHEQTVAAELAFLRRHLLGGQRRYRRAADAVTTTGATR